MSIAQPAVAVVVLAMAFCPRAYAPIFGGYPGLRSLIQQSEIIVVATVLERLPGPGDIGGSDQYKIEFNKVLKGNPPQKQAIVWLRHLEIEVPGGPIEYFAPSDEHGGTFRRGYRYVLFLVKSERGDGSLYENVNCMGSSFPISPLRDLASLKAESLPDTLILLFREYVDFRRGDLKQLEQQLNAFIHESDK
jgi:hypothetical protein